MNKIIFLGAVMSIFVSCSSSKIGSSSNSLAKLIVKEFPIDPENKYQSQRDGEDEQMRLRKIYPDLNLALFIKPNSPWVLITDKCKTQKELKKIKKMISKECPNMRIVECE